MSATKETFSNEMIAGVPWVIISKLLLFLVYFLVSVITVRNLGTADYGLYVLCKSIAEVLILICTLGMTASYMRYVPELAYHRNKAGIGRLISKASVIQLIAFAAASGFILSNAQWFDSLFSTSFNGVLLVTCGLVLFELIKNNINTLLTSLYKAKIQSILSLVQGILWLLFLFLFMNQQASVSDALMAPALAFAIVYFIAAIGLYRHVKQLDWRSPTTGIGKWRVLKHSGSVAVATIMRLMMLKYTELFFLGIEHDPETVGIYDLAYSIPMLAIVFIPAAIQDIFSSGFSEAYVKDKSKLPVLVKTYFKLIIMLSIPLAVYGFFFAPEYFHLIYGDAMKESGKLASWFCLFHALALISVPLSMAIQAKEKTANMLPTLALQLGVNVVLGYLLIMQLKLGIWGAFSAVVITFFVTIPIRLYRVKQLIGGLFIPAGFFFKVLTCCFSVGMLVYTAIPKNQPFALALSVPLYFAINIYLLFYKGILKKDELVELEQLFYGRLKPMIIRIEKVIDHTKQVVTHKLNLRRIYND